MLRLLEAGIVTKLSNDEVINYKLCQNPENDAVKIGPLKMKDFYGIFLLYIGGIFLFFGHENSLFCSKKKSIN